MNFDYGSLLTRTLQITWKHKVLWAILTLPGLLSFAAIPFLFAYIFIVDGKGSGAAGPVLDIIAGLCFILFFIANIVIYAFSSSAATLGIIRAEQGNGSLNFAVLLKDGLQYFWRQLALFLIVQLSIVVIFLVFFVCMLASSLLTMGLASICLQPLTFLLAPLMFLGMGVLEAACTAVVENDLGVLDALKRGLDVVRNHIWKYILITLTIYIGTSIISSLIMLPISLPAFLLMINMDMSENLGNYVPLLMGGMFCISLPIMAIVSVASQTLLKTCLTITYLQLTQPIREEQVVLLPKAP